MFVTTRPSAECAVLPHCLLPLKLFRFSKSHRPSTLLCQRARVRTYGGRKKRTALLCIRKMVPVGTFADWGEARPGYLEIDFVTHCGERAAGSFVHTLVLTDVASGWTECLALPVREQTLVVEAITGPCPRPPFSFRGLCTDNDGAFLNDTLLTLQRSPHRFHSQPRSPEERSGLGRAEERRDRPQADWL
jgi:hypothetical protein